MDPCENFFSYACGGWEKDNVIPDSEPFWDQLRALGMKHQNVLKRLVSDKEGRERYKNVSLPASNVVYTN